MMLLILFRSGLSSYNYWLSLPTYSQIRPCLDLFSVSNIYNMAVHVRGGSRNSYRGGAGSPKRQVRMNFQTDK